MKHHCSHRDEGPLHHTITLLLTFRLGLGITGLASIRALFTPSAIVITRTWLFLNVWSLVWASASIGHAHYLLSLGCFYPTMLACGCQYLLELTSKLYFGIPDMDRGAHSLGFVRYFPTLASFCHSCCGVAGRG